MNTINELLSIIDNENWLETRLTDPLSFNIINQKLVSLMNQFIKNDTLTRKLPMQVVERLISPHVDLHVNLVRPPKRSLKDLEDYVIDCPIEDEDELQTLLKTISNIK